MADLDAKDAPLPTRIVGNDEAHFVDVELQAGKRRMLTDAIVTVEEIFGQDPIPDSFFTIDAAGAIGDEIRLQVAATTVDSTAPDNDAPAVDETYTLIAADVGDELTLRDNIITFLNGQSGFTDALLKAQKAKDIPVVHITSTARSLTGEFYERPNAGDFVTSTTGTTATTDGFDTLKSRGKSTSLARDPDSPHRLGILGISGSVTVTPGEIDTRFIQFAMNGSPSSDLRVDGSVTPVEFKINADPDFDLFIESMEFYATANGIKFQQFLSLAALANGIDIAIRSNGILVDLFQSPLIRMKTTDDLKKSFAGGNALGWIQEPQAGADSLSATLVFPNPFKISKAGTFGTDDEIQITINDDLTAASLKEFTFQAFGFKKEP